MKKKVLIIVIAVVLILAAGGGVLAAVLINTGKKADRSDKVEETFGEEAREESDSASDEKEPDESEVTKLKEPEPENVDLVKEPEEKDFLVVIDAGHQQYGNSEQEPIGPGASETKAKVAGGTKGCSTGIPEYQLTLALAQKLEAELTARGYKVIMVRNSNDVNISNAERAEVANNAEADAFIRIHANGSTNSGANGAMTICQTQSNPYNGDLYYWSRMLSDYVLDNLVASAGCAKEYVWETDTMSGINWCQVPVTIVEVGYMTNPEEDQRLATEDYQNKLVQGIANGIDQYALNR